MSLRKDYDEDNHFMEHQFEPTENKEELSHKKRVRKMLDEQLERKRLKAEFDELDGEFDWDEFNR